MRVIPVVVLVLALGACRATAPSEAAGLAFHGGRIHALAAAPARSGLAVTPSGAALGHVPLDRDDPDALARGLAPLVADARPEVAARAAFELGCTRSEAAPGLLLAWLPADAPADVVAAAAQGLAVNPSAGVEAALVHLALRPSRPPEALEALFSHYRWRGAQPAPKTLPDAGLLAYAEHASPRGRAALGHLARAIKDPALLDPLLRLAKDAGFEVRRAAVLGLAEGAPDATRPEPARRRCLGGIAAALEDDDERVVAAACRAAASYDDPAAAELLAGRLGHADFNVRVTAIEGLGRRKAKPVASRLADLARKDPSVSVRFAAATQLVEIDPDAAFGLADALLADASPYVRTAGAAVLSVRPDETSAARLAKLAASDRSVRVRENAVDAFNKGFAESATARTAVRAALGDRDPVVVAVACGVVAKHGWTDLAGAVAAVPERFPGCDGADAREGAIAALSELDGPSHRRLFDASAKDPNPGVRAAAETALAALAGVDAPRPSRGADLTGTLLPGGAPPLGEEPVLVIETDKGTMRVRLFPEEAPVHCAHVAALARAGFYDGLTWHRVVPDFVIQGGCPRGDGAGNAGVTLPLEPTRIPFERGTLGMPRSNHPDTGGCQLFLCHSRAPHLDAQYTAFGRVIDGFDVLDRVDVESKILRARLEAAR